jgi:pimeloyl-ACP methyl ester carboxylesterase
MTATPVPFSLHVPDAAIADLRDRLGRTRFPDQAPAASWAYGTDTAYLRGLLSYWADGFDWRAQEAALNAFPQFKVDLHGIGLHYLHVAGVGPDAMPLLLLHGWPGSVFEFVDIIPRLTDPARFGGDPRDAFTVIAPSLPGYGLSFRPDQPRFGVNEMADCMAALMRDVLGYRRFAAQGGDWGAAVTSRLGYAHADAMIGIHVNLLMAVARDPAAFPDPTPEERRFLADLALWLKEETGYQWIQGTRPQTLAFALTDSPAGLAAWIVEKFRAWSDCGGDVESAIDRDRMLADIALYWFTGAIGYAEFPHEIVKPPRTGAQRVFTDLRRWTVMPKGGHFAALEQPALLAGEIQAFFRDLR